MDRSRLPNWTNSTPRPERPALAPSDAPPARRVIDRLLLAAIAITSAALLLRACLPS